MREAHFSTTAHVPRLTSSLSWRASYLASVNSACSKRPDSGWFPASLVFVRSEVCASVHHTSMLATINMKIVRRYCCSIGGSEPSQDFWGAGTMVRILVCVLRVQSYGSQSGAVPYEGSASELRRVPCFMLLGSSTR